MTIPWLQYFVREDPVELLGVFVVFCLASLVFVWLLGVVLARVSFILRRPFEIKSHLGLSLSLTCYSVLATAFLICLAMEYKARGGNPFSVLPWLAPVVAAMIVVLSLTGKVITEIAGARNKRRP